MAYFLGRAQRTLPLPPPLPSRIPHTINNTHYHGTIQSCNSAIKQSYNAWRRIVDPIGLVLSSFAHEVSFTKIRKFGTGSSQQHRADTNRKRTLFLWDFIPSGFRELDHYSWQAILLGRVWKNKAHKANNASSWWWNDYMTTWLLKNIDFPGFVESVTDRPTNQPTDGYPDIHMRGRI